MDRRDFLRTASAAGLLPLLPVMPAAAAPAAAAAAPVANEFMYGMAVFNARLRGASSAKHIARDLAIGKDAAAALQSRMVQDGFVTLPNAAGIARAPDPLMQRSYSRKTAETLKNMLKEKAEEFIEADAPEDINPDTPDPLEA